MNAGVGLGIDISANKMQCISFSTFFFLRKQTHIPRKPPGSFTKGAKLLKCLTSSKPVALNLGPGTRTYGRDIINEVANKKNRNRVYFRDLSPICTFFRTV